MVKRRLAEYYLIIFMAIIVFFFPYLEKYKEGMSKDTPKFWKGFGIAIMLYVLVGGCMFIVPIPMIVNGIYEETQGVVEEFEFIKQKDELRKKYTVTLVNPDTQKEKTYYEVYSEGIKKGDHIEIKKYLMTPFPILVKKINGEETEIYKKYSDEFVWDSMLDRILATIVFLLNIFVHIIKYQKKKNERATTRRGNLFWYIWNYGCAVFSIFMFCCIWIPIHSSLVAYICGGILVALFAIYQIGGYAGILESIGFTWNVVPETKNEETPLVAVKEMAKQLVEETEKERSWAEILGEQDVSEADTGQSSIQLRTMNYTDAEKYCAYKYNKKKQSLRVDVKIIEGGCVLAACIFGIMCDSILRWIIPGIAAIIFVTAPFILKYYFRKKVKPIENGARAVCEYAIVSVTYDEESKFICTDGHEIREFMEYDDDAEVEKGEEAVVVYLSATNKIYTEKIETFDKIFNEK